MLTHSAIFVFGVLIFSGYVHSEERELMILPREIDSCAPFVNQSIEVLNVTLRKDSDSEETFLSGDLIIKELLPEGFTIHAQILKCVDEEQSSCNNFVTLDDTSFCKDVGDPEKIWIPIMEHIETMKPSCPIPVGSYKLVEVPVSKILRENIECKAGFWRSRITVMNGERLLGCVLGYGEIKQKRRPRKKPT